MHRILLSVIKYFVKGKEKRYKKQETTPWAIPTTGQNPCLSSTGGPCSYIILQMLFKIIKYFCKARWIKKKVIKQKDHSMGDSDNGSKLKPLFED